MHTTEYNYSIELLMNKIKHSEYEKPGSLSDEQGLQVMVL